MEIYSKDDFWITACGIQFKRMYFADKRFTSYTDKVTKILNLLLRVQEIGIDTRSERDLPSVYKILSNYQPTEIKKTQF